MPTATLGMARMVSMQRGIIPNGLFMEALLPFSERTNVVTIKKRSGG
jgi:hypothetical protein